jgi:hypothetical protein
MDGIEAADRVCYSVLIRDVRAAVAHRTIPTGYGGSFTVVLLAAFWSHNLTNCRRVGMFLRVTRVGWPRPPVVRKPVARKWLYLCGGKVNLEALDIFEIKKVSERDCELSRMLYAWSARGG